MQFDLTVAVYALTVLLFGRLTVTTTLPVQPARRVTPLGSVSLPLSTKAYGFVLSRAGLIARLTVGRLRGVAVSGSSLRIVATAIGGLASVAFSGAERTNPKVSSGSTVVSPILPDAFSAKSRS